MSSKRRERQRNWILKWIMNLGMVVILQLAFQMCHGSPSPIEDSIQNQNHEKNLSVEESIYERKYYISIPEPLVCFPGFNDRQLELENQTLLQEIYSFKAFKPADLVLVAASPAFPLPMYASLRILYVLARYADSQWLPDFTQNLVDAKIQGAVAGLQIGQIKAKIETINNRLSTVLNDKQPLDVRKTELAVATDKSEEILILFGDKDGIFKRNPGASMPFLILFSGPYNVLLGVASSLIPSKKEYYEKQLQRLQDTVDYYKSRTLTARLDAILYDKTKKYPDALTIVKNTWNYRVLSYDYEIKLLDPQGGWGPCNKIQKAETYNQTEADAFLFQFQDEYKDNITHKYELFFSAPAQVFKLQDCKKTCPDVSAALRNVDVNLSLWFALLSVFVCYLFSK